MRKVSGMRPIDPTSLRTLTHLLSTSIPVTAICSVQQAFTTSAVLAFTRVPSMHSAASPHEHCVDRAENIKHGRWKTLSPHEVPEEGDQDGHKAGQGHVGAAHNNPHEHGPIGQSRLPVLNPLLCRLENWLRKHLLKEEKAVRAPSCAHMRLQGSFNSSIMACTILLSIPEHPNPHLAEEINSKNPILSGDSIVLNVFVCQTAAKKALHRQAEGESGRAAHLKCSCQVHHHHEVR